MKHPLQRIHIAADGCQRFVSNKIVKDLLDFATLRGFSLNQIAQGDYDVDDYEQFMQLIGYSLSGYGDLSAVRDETYEAAVRLSLGSTEESARIEALESMLEKAREGVKAAAVALFRIHEDNLEP